jgi:hypothetical protein
VKFTFCSAVRITIFPHFINMGRSTLHLRIRSTLEPGLLCLSTSSLQGLVEFYPSIHALVFKAEASVHWAALGHTTFTFRKTLLPVAFEC